MPTINFNQNIIEANSELSVLDNVLNAKQSLAYGCKSGVCQRCLVKVNAGDIPKGSQVGLSLVQKQQQLIMSCCAYPNSDLSISNALQDSAKQIAEISAINRLSENMLSVELSLDLLAHPGQFVRVFRSASFARCYSLCHEPNGLNKIEIQIQRHPHGRFSQWAFERLEVGMPLAIEGPYGDCHYQPKFANKALIFVCAQSGFAPVLGIIRDAIAQGHTAAIEVHLIGHEQQHFYASPQLSQVTSAHGRIRAFFYSSAQSHSKFALNDEDQDSRAAALNLKLNTDERGDCQAYICGPKALLENYQSQLLDFKLKPEQILCEYFVDN